MTKRFKSVNRALKRGHLKVRWKTRFTGQGNPITGEPEKIQIPYLVRVIKKNNKKSTLGRRTVGVNSGNQAFRPREIFYSNL